MKAAKYLRNLSGEELRSRLQETKKELFKLRGSATGAASAKVKKSRKNLARIFTIMQEKAMMQKKGGQQK